MDNTDTNQKLTSNGLRGALANHHQNNTTSNTNMSGGKKRKSHKHKSHKMTRKVSRKKRSRRGGMSCTKKGGSYCAILKQAVVPFGLFSFLKKKQNKHHNKKTFRKHKKSFKR